MTADLLPCPEPSDAERACWPDATRDYVQWLERYAALGEACEAHGQAGFKDNGEMWFDPPADMIAEHAVAKYITERKRAFEEMQAISLTCGDA